MNHLDKVKLPYAVVYITASGLLNDGDYFYGNKEGLEKIIAVNKTYPTFAMRICSEHTRLLTARAEANKLANADARFLNKGRTGNCPSALPAWTWPHLHEQSNTLAYNR